MGTVIIDSGTQVSLEEVEGNATLQQLYEDVSCEHYTDTHREKTIRAWGKLARKGWPILPVLHELTKGKNDKLRDAAKEAIKKIDPGAPNISGKPPEHSTPMLPMTPDSRVTSIKKYEERRFPVQTGHTTVWRTPEIKKVTFTEIAVKKDLAEGTRVNSDCSFCEKQTLFTDKVRNASEMMAGKLYCNFCLRNEFYRIRHVRNTMLLSFRGIIGYYYHSFHVAKVCNMFMSDIESYIALHTKFGIQNPLFRYDPESFLWFIDFSKVGNKPRQMPLKYILETVVNILASFNLYENIRDCSPAQVFGKYKEAINDFHHHRRRPAGQKILIPTFYGCGIPHESSSLNKAIPVNILRNFVPSCLIENYKVRQRGGGI